MALPTMACMSHITRILSKIDQGDQAAVEQLLPLVCEELRQLAAAKLAQERPGQTLQATAKALRGSNNLVSNIKSYNMS